MLNVFYETYEDNLMEVGHSTPSVPVGQGTTLTEDRDITFSARCYSSRMVSV